MQRLKSKSIYVLLSLFPIVITFKVRCPCTDLISMRKLFAAPSDVTQTRKKRKKTNTPLFQKTRFFFFSSWNVACWHWSCLVTRQVAASIQAPRLFDGCLQLTVRELSLKCTLIPRSKWRVSRGAHRVHLTFLCGASFFFLFPFFQTPSRTIRWEWDILRIFLRVTPPSK